MRGRIFNHLTFIILSFILTFGYLTTGVLAEECDNPGNLSDPVTISSCISKYAGILDAISKANSNNRADLNRLNSQITNLKSQINSLNNQVTKLQNQIFESEVKVGVQQELLAAKVRSDYVGRRRPTLLLSLFQSENAGGFLKNLETAQLLARRDKIKIEEIVGQITRYNDQVTNTKEQKEKLDKLKINVDKQAQFLATEVVKADKYTSDLGGKIAALTARQNALIAQKTGTFTTTVGDVPLADDPASRPDYNPGFSPAYAVFSFGAPHFRGMSQYGALGRAKSGQNYKQILEAYYGNVEIKKMPLNANISTTLGSMSLEGRYLRGIAEMPTVWADQGGFEALKAQAIAARSYAVVYGRTICTTEACQVFSNSKANSPGRWGDAVRETEGEVVVSRSSGQIISTWYASTSGGYQQGYSTNGHNTPGFWDTTSDWTRWADGAYEVNGGSPWFYKGWYKSRTGKTCGRSHPWLNTTEFADIVNAVIVVANNGDTSGIFPEDARTCWGDNDTAWSRDRLAQEADKHGGQVTSINSVRVDHGSNGKTSRVVIGTNRGEVNVSGEAFYKGYNLRAMGALALKSYLFNIEKK